MPANGGGVFSETLQKITNTKLEELSKTRSAFETAKASILSSLKDEVDPLKRLDLLSQGVKDCYAMKKNPDLELELENLDSFMAQSKYDPSITPEQMHGWEESLLRHLDMQSSKLEYASLYGQLVTEWLSTEKAASGAGEDVNMAEGFEDVGDSIKKEARHGWEKVVFEAAGVDETALKKYLVRLFGLTDQTKPASLKALDQLRGQLAAFENSLTAQKQFNSTSLTWVIEGLLATDLLTDERREVLREFLGNSTILAEVADVLNMRLSSLSTWSWGESVALEQQRKITGIYNIVMHEDVLQAIFLHYIGVKWSVFLKGAFRKFRKFDGAWKSPRRSIPQLDLKRREYYLGRNEHPGNSVDSARDAIYRKHYFMAGLMSRDNQKQTAVEGEEEANYTSDPPALSGYTGQIQPLQAQIAPVQNIFTRQARMMPVQQASYYAAPQPAAFGAVPEFTYSGDDARRDWSNDDDSDSGDRCPMEDKQRLIRLLSAEIALNTKLHGEVTAFHSVFESWNSLLPHETIIVVMALLGVSETWITFFRKFLRAPLKFEDDPATEPRTRRRGTPASHALSEVFGESILFCLDFAVNQAAGGNNIHRLNEDFWFWSRDHEVAKTAWGAVSDFVNATRTYVDFSKSGTVRIARDPAARLEIDESLPAGDIRWGFLKLSTATGKFEIDPGMVDKHIVDLRRQLTDKRKSVIAFIQTWNTFAATFFTSNFGKPANCFGRAHVDEILATHQRIQREVFASTSSASLLDGEAEQPDKPITDVVGYLKHVLRARFGVADVPDAYLFFPIELGGLDLRSPFVATLPIREAVVADPGQLLDDFVEAERNYYTSKKLAFERDDFVRQQQWAPDDPREHDTFFSFDEFARHREGLGYRFTGNLESVFQRLLEVPAEGGGIRTASGAVSAAVAALAGSSSASKGITGIWHMMDPYWRWVAQLYGPEAIRRFGGLNIVEPGLLPMGMVSIFRDKRVKWQ